MIKKIIFSVIGLLVILELLFAVYKHIELNKEIETVSASVINENEEIIAADNGIIKELKFKNFDKVQEGDIIAEIDITNQPETNCINQEEISSADQKAVKEYENAAIMYKDGVISKEEYDNSLKQYKTETANNNAKCKPANEIIKSIHANANGVILYADLKEGDTVKYDSSIGIVNPENAAVKAYFSPKYKNRIKVGDKAKISIVKYPEKIYSGEVVSKDKIDINGQAIIVRVNEDTKDLNIKNGDGAIVTLLKK